MRRSSQALLAAALAAATAVACDASPTVPDARSCQQQQLFPVSADTDLDLLFVVDESPAMAPYQEQLAENLTFFVQVLRNVTGGLPSVHIGFVSADPARAGVLLAPDGCGLAPGQRFIADTVDPASGTRVQNYTGQLEDVVRCLGTPGAQGATTAAPLASMRAALEPTNAANAGFRRAGAAIYVGFLAAQDDCSGPSSPGDPLACAAEGVRCASGAPGAPGSYDGCVAASGPHVDAIDGYADFLRGLLVDPHRILVGVAAGPAAPFVVAEGPALASSCPADARVGALPAVRLAAFANRFPGPAVESLCTNDWSSMLQPIAQDLAGVLSVPCLGPVDTVDLAPEEPGLQLECAVADVRFPDTEEEVSRTMPRCRMIGDETPDPASLHPCWWVKDDAACTTGTSGLRFGVERGPDAEPPTGTYVQVSCASCDRPAP